jgi:hypothetical protein
MTTGKLEVLGAAGYATSGIDGAGKQSRGVTKMPLAEQKGETVLSLLGRWSLRCARRDPK